MCGRVVWIWDPVTGKLLRKLVDDPEQDPAVAHVLHKERFNVPPASHLPVVDGRGEPAMAVARWGFPIPKRPNGVFNTRIETAAESPMWRGLLGTSHCLFPVKGFYEWRRSGKQRIPYYIQRKDGQPLLLAGLIQERTWDGERKNVASILTCAPNPLMDPVHDRMPVIIETAQAGDWLAADAQTAFDLAVPAADVLQMHQVGPDVGDTKNDHPGLMEPIERQGLGAFA
ncbi:MAG: SOS response-associated peptidase [Thermoplasmatota archaeon]